MGVYTGIYIYICSYVSSKILNSKKSKIIILNRLPLCLPMIICFPLAVGTVHINGILDQGYQNLCLAVCISQSSIYFPAFYVKAPHFGVFLRIIF